jgi:hypothetical protein
MTIINPGVTTMPLLPNLIERFFLLDLNQAPGPMLDVWGAASFRIVLAALRLGVFDALATSPLSSAGLAERVKIDRTGAATLIDVLESCGYVRKRGDRYSNTAMTAKWLVSSSPSNFSAFVLYWGGLIEQRWNDLEQSLRSGKPAVNLYEWIEHQPEMSNNFQMGMVAIAKQAGGEIIGKLNVPANAHVLDVGGGHATYSILLCQKNPSAQVTVLDSPQALNTGRENVTTTNLQDRIQLRAGNFMRDELGSGYDLMLLFNIIHGLSAIENTDLFKRGHQSLNPGGQIIVLEQLAGGVPLPMVRAFNRILGMSYYHLIGGKIYAYKDVASWMSQAGYTKVSRINLLKAAGSSLIIGVK